MRKALTFARLDFLTLKPFITWKVLLAGVLMPVFLVWSNRSFPFAMSTIVMMGALYVSYPFAVGEKNGIDSLYATLSIGRSAVVLGRYVFSLLLNLCAGVLAYGIVFVSCLVLNIPFAPLEALLILLVLLGVFIFSQAFQLPVFFKLGHTKGKFISYLPFFILPLGVVLINALTDRFSLTDNLSVFFFWLFEQPALLGGICLAVLALVELVSYRVSLAFYRKRDF